MLRPFFFVTETIQHPERECIALWKDCCYEESYLIARAEEWGFDNVQGVTILAPDIDKATAIYNTIKG